MVDFKSSPLLKGNKTIGNNAVTDIGKVSVIHQIATQEVEARTALAESLSPSG